MYAALIKCGRTNTFSFRYSGISLVQQHVRCIQAYDEFSRALGHLTSLERCTVVLPAIRGFAQLKESLSSMPRLKYFDCKLHLTEAGRRHSHPLEWDRLLHALAGAAALESLDLGSFDNDDDDDDDDDDLGSFGVTSNSVCASSNAWSCVAFQQRPNWTKTG